MAGSLADRYQKRLDAAAKKGESSFRVTRNGKKSSAIDKGVVDAIRSDESTIIQIVEDNTEVIQAALGDAIVTALEEIGLVAEGAAKRLCPVDTGRLRNSITHAFVDDRAVAIGTNVEYALYVHEPVRMPNGKTRSGVPFLTDAATQNADRYRSILKKHLESA